MERPRPYFPAYMKKLRRGPATTAPKDAGIIIAYSAIGKDSRVVEVGTGSGFLTIQLSRIVKEITTYEMRKEFAEIAQENFKKLGLDNIISKVKDGTLGIEEKDLDLVVIDIHNAELLASSAHSALKEGGMLAGHCLSIEQAKALYLECKKYFKEVLMVENISREFEVNEMRTRPKHMGIIHTAYLVFARK